MTNGPCADVLEIVIKDLPSLQDAYMSFLCNGGLFISTTQGHELGDEVQLLLTLLDEPAAFNIKGRVVWVTPERAQGIRPAGIGVEFSKENAAIHAKIVNYLRQAPLPDRPTHTL